LHESAGAAEEGGRGNLSEQVGPEQRTGSLRSVARGLPCVRLRA